MYSRDHRSPTPKSETVSRVMSANKSKNTGPELLLRRALWFANLRGYRLHKTIKLPSLIRRGAREGGVVEHSEGSPPYEGGVDSRERQRSGRRGGSLSNTRQARARSVRPDISYTKNKLAIFVHGCFWHHCPKCSPSLPKHNTPFWKAKFDRNRERDARKLADLTSANSRS